jgi:hypothetical protein
MELINFIQDSLNSEELILFGLAGYELVVRRKKTTKNYSLISLIGKLFKNRKKNGDEFK